MRIYTYSQARQRLASLLDQVRREGAVLIRRRDGQAFIVQVAAAGDVSPLDVPTLGLPLDVGAVVDLVREGRRSGDRFARGGSQASRTSRVAENGRPPRARRRRGG